MLRVENLHVLQRGFDLRLESWRAAPGELHAVLGCNGAGKSTLLRAVAGELPTRGSVTLHGRPLEDWPALQRARHVAVLPQSSELNFGFTAAEVVRLGLTPLSLGWRSAAAELRRVMELTDCAHLAERPYPRLSGGERQRVHLARVLLQLSQTEREPLLLLDEPTSAQDLGHQHRTLQLAAELAERKGYAVVAVLHDLNQALRYARMATLLDGGRLVRTAPPSVVLTPETVKAHWRYSATEVRLADGVAALL